MPSKKSTASAANSSSPATPKVAKKSAAPKKTAAKSAPKKAAATKTAAKKTATKKATTTPVVAEPVVVEPVVAAPVATETVVEKSQLELFEERFTAITEQVNALRSMSTSLAGDLKSLRKDVVRAVKKSGRRKRTPLTAEEKANRAPSGFAKPTIISDELCSFLGKPIGTEVARTEVTKFLSLYIKEHKLQDTVNKKIIHPDAKLKALLNCSDSDELTYFTIQKYMKGHFKPSASTSS